MTRLEHASREQILRVDPDEIEWQSICYGRGIIMHVRNQMGMKSAKEMDGFFVVYRFWFESGRQFSCGAPFMYLCIDPSDHIQYVAAITDWVHRLRKEFNRE